MSSRRKDEQTIISALISRLGSTNDQQKERGIEILQSLSEILFPEDFDEEIYGDIYELFLGDMEIGMVPDYEACIGEL